MKVLLLAVVVLVVTAGFIGWSSWYVCRMCDGILGILEDMAEFDGGEYSAFGEGYSKIEGLWKKGEMWLHVLVGHDAADMVKELFVEMGMRYIGQDMMGYRVVREKLCLQVEKIREGERIVVDSIM